MFVAFVLDCHGNPLMPTDRAGRVRRWLKSGEAKIVNHEPLFTIQFTEDKPEHQKYVKNLILALDTGYSYLGYSVIDPTTGKEIIGGYVKLRTDITGLLDERRMHRKNRRSKKRYRKPTYANQHTVTQKNTLPPSVRHKIDTTKKFAKALCDKLPIQSVRIEMGQFDPAKMNNPNIKGEEYQKGTQYGFFNVREAILYRDKHICQNPNCTHYKDGKGGYIAVENRKYKDDVILEAHHVIYRGPKYEGTDSANNLVTLCTQCHASKNHEPGGFLYEWLLEKKQYGNLREATFMNIIKSYLTKELHDKTLPNHITVPFEVTYGYLTKSKRIECKIQKTHHADAFVIAGGTDETKMVPDYNVRYERRNNRALEYFRDSKWYDARELPNLVEASGKQLSSERKKRNTHIPYNNNRQFRMPIIDPKTGKRKKITKGARLHRGSIIDANGVKTNTMSLFSKNAKVLITDNWSNSVLSVTKGQTFISGGQCSNGQYVYVQNMKGIMLKEPDPNKMKTKKPPKKLVPSRICKLMSVKKGLVRIL